MTAWEVVKYAINKKGLTQEQVSKRLNKSKNYINASIYGKRSPSVQTLGKILHAIGWHLEAVSDDGKERITLE